MIRTVQVELGERSYQVRVGDGLLAELGATVAALGGATSVVLVSDSNVGPLYAPRALDSLRAEELAASALEFPAGEAHKNLQTYGKLLDRLFQVVPAVDRRTVLVALGGGVAGDLAGFVAATALRGLRWVQCPTTLLADVDASVGGKTAVDHPAGKNLVGAFHQPAGVLIDVDTLRTLPSAELRCGLAECVKHAVLADRTLLEFLEDRAEEVLACRPEVLVELVARNVEIKAAVVSADERESGQRENLNFGHTFAHAIETFVGYGAIAHGEAVALGMSAACRLALRRGFIEAEVADRIERLLKRLGLPVRRAGLDPQRLWEIMQHDKKARGGAVRLVLPVVLGQVAVFGDITPEAVQEAIRAIQE